MATMATLSRISSNGRQTTRQLRLRARQRTSLAFGGNLTGSSNNQQQQELPTRILLNPTATTTTNTTTNNYGFSRTSTRSFSLLPPSKEKKLVQASFPSVSILPSNNNYDDDNEDNEDNYNEDNAPGKTSEKAKTASKPNPKAPKRKKTKRSARLQRKTAAKGKKLATFQAVERDLQKWYKEHHNVTFKETCFALRNVPLKGGKGALQFWTGQFTCPITEEAFQCGTLRGLGLTTKQMREENGEILYNKAAAARVAAMGRALDCFQWRQSQEEAQKQNVQTEADRICMELPYMFGSQPTITTPTIMETNAVEEPENNDEKDEDEEEMESSDESDSDEGEDSDGYYLSDEEDDEEYTIQYLPGTSPNATSQQPARNPIARVIGNWANSSSSTLDLRNTNQSDAVAPLIVPDPESELLGLLENACAWIDQEQPMINKEDDEDSKGKNAHRVMLRSADSPQTLDIANSILNGLATANRRAYFPDEPRGVETVATRIVKYLWSTTAAHPNADTFIAYLGCLEGPNPQDVAVRAKSMLDAMKEGAPADITGEKPYPKPSIGVVNAVVQLVAQVGGESGRFDLDEVDNPNRETFLSVLSSMCYPATIPGETGGFDPIFAKDCIERMTLLAEQNPADSSLRPDTSVYNAGLPWSGGLQSALSRPYMKPRPWDSHAEIYRKGFISLNEEDQAMQDAYRMNAWLEEMASLRDVAAPNIETYEAVIQAYVRTGTKEGLQQAEKLLNSLGSASSPNLKARVQTFHPVIAAWAYSGDKEGPQKVNKWINQVDTWGEGTKQDLDSDFRLRETPVLANATRVIRRLEAGDEISDTEASDLVDIAHGCSAHLKDLSAALQDSNNQEGVGIALDAQTFLLVLETWGMLGVHFLEQPDGADHAKQALEKMHETLHDYEGLIASLHDKVASNNDASKISHLMDSAYELYSLMLTILRGTMGVQKFSESDWTLENHLNTIEKWVRRVDEFSQVQATMDKSHGEHLHGDMYTYHGPASLPHTFAESQAEFLVEILKLLRDDFIEDCSSSPKRGDMIRLSFLIMKVLPSVSNDLDPHLSLSSTYKEVVRTVCHLSNSPVETEALLGGVLSHVEWLREQRSPVNIDLDAITKEMRKLCPSLPNSKANRPRKPRRGPSSSGLDRPPFRRYRSSSHRSSSSMASHDDYPQSKPQDQSTGSPC